MNVNLIREVMEERSITVKALSEMCPVPKSTLERILSGATPNPTFQTVADIAAALEISLDDIAGIERPESAAAASNHTHVVHVQSAEVSTIYRTLIRQKDSWIARLAVAVAVLVVYNMFRWILDVSNPSIGWVRSEDTNLTGVLVFFLVVFAVALILLGCKVLLPAFKKNKQE